MDATTNTTTAMNTTPHILFIRKICAGFDRSDSNSDLAQEVILKLSNANPKTENIKGYIYQTIKNTFLDVKRHNQVVRNYNPPKTNCHIQTSLDCTLRGKVKALPRELRKYIWLLAMGYKYEEISNITHNPIGTVKAKIHRARTMIKKSL